MGDLDKLRLSGAMDGGSPAAARGPGRPETGVYLGLPFTKGTSQARP
jgi:hypothetical protein